MFVILHLFDSCLILWTILCELYLTSFLLSSYYTPFIKLLSSFVVASLFSLLFSLLQHLSLGIIME